MSQQESKCDAIALALSRQQEQPGAVDPGWSHWSLLELWSLATHATSFIFYIFKSSVLIICSPFLFGRVLRPYYASLWPDPNCAACGALEPIAAYRYTCSTCADAGASIGDAASTRNTFTSVRSFIHAIVY